MIRFSNNVGRFLWCALLGALLLLPLDTVAAASPTRAGTAQLRLIHASPDAPAIDVYVDGQRLTTALKFTDATTYVSFPSGSHTVQVFSATAGPASQALLAASVEFNEGVAYTIVAADRLAQLGAVVLTDNLAVGSGEQAYIRLIHASPDAPSVADVAVAGGPIAYRNLPFKAASPYLPIAPGSYAFEVRPAGTAQVLATTGALTLEPGRLYSAFVVGQLSDNTFQALLLPDNAGTGGVAAAPKTGAGAGAEPRYRFPTVLLVGALLASFALIRRRGLRREVRGHAPR